MRRAMLVAGVVSLFAACIINPRDLDPDPIPPANTGLSDAALARQAWVRQCGKGLSEKREDCIQVLQLKYNLARRR